MSRFEAKIDLTPSDTFGMLVSVKKRVEEKIMLEGLLAQDIQPIEPSKQQIEHCVTVAAREFKVPRLLGKAILEVEGGKIGSISANTNGSYDLGVAQLNTINLPAIQANFDDISVEDLVMDPCKNIRVSMWFLSKKYKERGNLWEAAADYNSKTPRVRIRYIQYVMNAYMRLLEDETQL